jgi:16S rRNA (adenine1518-N6/adenine1519-N6)-dimethyltransferase
MIRPRKSLGQNFLRDQNTARKIASSLRAKPEDRVIEIGAGTGAMTRFLAEEYSNFVAVEIDNRAIDHLKETLPDVEIVAADILKCSYDDLRGDSESLFVIGNLPYYLTSEIIFRLLDEAPIIREAVFMMQYEVARRLVAVPRTKEYGILSVAIQLACTPEFLFPVSRNVFFPKPDVRSAVVRLTFPVKDPLAEGLGAVLPAHISDPSPDGSGAPISGPVSEPDSALVRRVIRTAFNQRRKTLRNSLKMMFQEADTQIPDHFAGCRAEELEPKDFIELTRYLQSR